MRRARDGFHSPVVRRLLAEHGLDPAEVTGTGAGGRITRADVEAVVEARAAPAEVAPAPEPAIAPAAAEPTPPEPVSDVVPAAPAAAPDDPRETESLVPFTAIRRRIADNLRASITTAAHAFCAVEADFERVDRARRAHGDAWREREGFSLTYLPFVARALVDALAEFPHLNASVVDDGLLVRHDVHLGIAVDLDHEGLIVPVIHHAGRRSLADIARAVADLAGRARAGELQPVDVAGGTFTVTNPGPSGTLLSVPIINQPQVGILATDTVRRRPVMIPTGDGGEGMAIHSVGMLGLSFDHRAVDGAYAASFVSRVKAILETREWEPEVSAQA